MALVIEHAVATETSELTPWDIDYDGLDIDALDNLLEELGS